MFAFTQRQLTPPYSTVPLDNACTWDSHFRPSCNMAHGQTRPNLQTPKAPNQKSSVEKNRKKSQLSYRQKSQHKFIKKKPQNPENPKQPAEKTAPRESPIILYLWLTHGKRKDSKWGIALFNRFPKHVKFLDTTLRDGEQTPGVSLVPENKLRIAQRLDELGVDVIEAGFAAVSEGEMEAVSLIAKQGFKGKNLKCGKRNKKRHRRCSEKWCFNHKHDYPNI